MDVEKLLFLMPLLPFLGFLALGLAGSRLGRPAVSTIACVGPGLAFVIAVMGFFRVVGAEDVTLNNSLWTWIRSGDLSISFAFSLDRLSSIMTLVVAGVGTLIHVYSIGYMRHDPGYARYFAYLNLFMAAMLVLILADNVVFMFLGWEGVGLCSYLLIGFWYDSYRNCAAGIKAFVVNRIGDLGFLLGIFWIGTTFGTFEFAAINQAVGGQDVFWIAVLLFIGATGKSAQIPLFVWLPDAMAGPTPVSALIHAATMVTSGVYMVARLGPLYTAAPDALAIIATVGALTAIVAAATAVSQRDIKKVLAYSTVSQLGYMFLAAGVGAYGVAIFHVVTHAFFKALLFLGAGAVIDSMHHEQDMRRMGGLRHRLPHTFPVFLIGSLALAGIPIFAGFFSKDEILHTVHQVAATHDGFYGSWLSFLWIVGLITAVLTAFYVARQVALVFFGDYRGQEEPLEDGDATDHEHHAPQYDEIHESPWIMRIPLFVLAGLSVVGGFLAVPHFLDSGVVPGDEGKVAGWILGGALAAIGLAGGFWLFLADRPAVRRVLDSPAGRAARTLSSKGFYFDGVYLRLVVKPLWTVAEVLFYLVDRFLIDFLLVGGSGFVARTAGQLLRRLQSGRAPTYAMWFLCGALVILLLALLRTPDGV